MREEIKQSVLTIEQQSRLSLTGVSSVNSFSENAISLTVNGKRVLIAGAKMKVLSFSEGSGNFAASGEFVSVRFGGSRGGFSKLFK